MYTILWLYLEHGATILIIEAPRVSPLGISNLSWKDGCFSACPPKDWLPDWSRTPCLRGLLGFCGAGDSSYIYIYVYVYIHIHKYICIYIYAGVCVCVCVNIYICIHVCVFKYAYMYVRMYVSVCL